MSDRRERLSPKDYQLDELEELPSDPDPATPKSWVDHNRLYDVALEADLDASDTILNKDVSINIGGQRRSPWPTDL